MGTAYRRASLPKRIYVAGLLLCLLFIYLSNSPLRFRSWHLVPASWNVHDNELACRGLAGSEDVLVIMKTGSTELIDKLPIHLSTTFQCYPNHLIFSDFEEDFEGVHILDALDAVSPQIKAEHSDFELWRRLQQDGRASLQQTELSGPYNRLHGTTGKDDNPGWRLDKWKFLPMMNRTLFEHPDKKWYLFVETDTFIFWQTALQHLKALDWTKPFYLGSEMMIGDDLFAHGGSGFAVSRPAMELVTKLYAENQAEWEQRTDEHWAGDCILGIAFLQAGVPLFWAAPTWQGMPVGKLDYQREDFLCYPTVSYHHSSPFVVQEMWDFEQKWIAEPSSGNPDYLRHIDVYANYILPRTSESKLDWDNYSSDDQGVVDSLAACQVICLANEACIQYAFNGESHCLTALSPNLGEESSGVSSGWIKERMEAYVHQADNCHGAHWIT